MVELISLCTSGLEAAPAYEIKSHGYNIIDSMSGKVKFSAPLEDIPSILNNFRTVDRILIKVGEFYSNNFDDLFDKVYNLNWAEYVEKNGRLVVEKVKITNSDLSATGAVASIIKKAIYEKLKSSYKCTIWEENEVIYPIYVYLKDNVVTVALDTVYKESLAKRGYRTQHVSTSLRETIAASMVLLSKWEAKYTLIDPFCGSGTIPIEAALYASGKSLKKEYVCEKWRIFNEFRHSFYPYFEPKEINYRIYGYDKSYKAISIAKENASLTNVKIHFEKKAMESLESSNDEIYFISNLPYGMKEKDNTKDTYKKMRHLLRAFPNGKFYFITPESNFEEYFGRKANKKFKFQNSGIWVWFYMFYQ